MPATSPLAVIRKLDNRKSKKDIMREAKIVSLGGLAIRPSIVYGVPLTPEKREERIKYLFDLMYPNKQPKKQRTRARYSSPEEARRHYNRKARERYASLRESVRVANKDSTIHCKSPWYYLASGAKNRAKKNNLPCDIDAMYVMSIMPDVCPVLGIPLVFNKESTQDNSPTLDRFIPALGYVKGNINVISQKANRLKNDGTLDDIRKLFRWMLNTTKSLDFRL